MRLPVADADGVAIRRSAGDSTHADAAACTRYILDDHGLAEGYAHVLGKDARERIGGPARRIRHDDRDWPRRIGLRRRGARYGREHGSARGQMQKRSSGKYHNIPPNELADIRKRETPAVPAGNSALKLYGRQMTRKGIPGRL